MLTVPEVEVPAAEPVGELIEMGLPDRGGAEFTEPPDER
jgi:hypothetical protein